MKLTLKLILFVCLFSSVAFADGDMTGGKACPQGQHSCLSAGQPPIETDANQEDSALDIIQKYLFSIFR